MPRRSSQLAVRCRTPVDRRFSFAKLSSGDRERLLAHFLALDEDDRLLRFGQIVPDHVIENYVRNIDFAHDTVFGVFDDQLLLVGVGHLAYLPAEGDKRTAEYGVSRARKRARPRHRHEALRARRDPQPQHAGVATLYIHCLSRNATMMHIAKKAGMKIEYAYGEADAYLSLRARGPDEPDRGNAAGAGRRVRLRDQASGVPHFPDVRGIHAHSRCCMSECGQRQRVFAPRAGPGQERAARTALLS